MEQERRIGRWPASLSSFWLLSTPRRSSRDGNRRARRQGRRLDEAGLRTRTQTGRGGATRPVERVGSTRTTGPVKNETPGQDPETTREDCCFFLPTHPNRVYKQTAGFTLILRPDSLAQPSGVHPILGSCGARLAGRHAQLIPLEGGTSSCDNLIQKFHTGTRRGMNHPWLILPAKEQTGRDDGAGKENREVAASFLRSSCFPHRAGALETATGEHGGRDGDSTSATRPARAPVHTLDLTLSLYVYTHMNMYIHTSTFFGGNMTASSAFGAFPPTAKRGPQKPAYAHAHAHAHAHAPVDRNKPSQSWGSILQ